ncbi:uncharacterized protein LOC119674243 [Teleopsis dalmanni]|uniref:uncharacterized protein LOC119674243 n=1 Tax=Teleopsis dalmanni TaxID=139649 RepID=UPI0018CE1B44|nr:uncharacterized protein LOC119674243 [Teleopsis dalmanni]
MDQDAPGKKSRTQQKRLEKNAASNPNPLQQQNLCIWLLSKIIERFVIQIVPNLERKLSLISLYGVVSSHVEFTNMLCKTFDKSFVTFDYCYLKSVNRSYKYISMRAKLLQLPVTNIVFNYAMLKRENGYKPFLYNITFEACSFLKSQNNPVTKFVYNVFKDHSNVNHTCPYNHDVIIEKLDTKSFADRLSRLPIPFGQYAISGAWYVSNIHRADVALQFKIYD